MKIWILILAAALCLAACSPADHKDGTLGDRDGDGMIEEEGGLAVRPAEVDGESGSFRAVKRVKDADDAVNFIGANVYSLCRDALPAMTGTRVLTDDDRDALTFSAGIEGTEGISDVIVSESSLADTPFFVVMLRTDGKETEKLAEALAEGIDPEKWDHASAKRAAAVTLDNDIVLVMGDREQVDAVIGAVTRAADGVYDHVGDVKTVLG